ncbi:uncharacterized protein F5Z01DRAFT_699609 [Emericellopsis atlantica]|uniref:Rhodopsin domain-containing protein n=1 Tax=Emericellopsis atlantica TaxID=2614577 RepID=A0A9P8CQM7_9HYPO|nr:uncharacterized protein F5Z01DRAFT_699609 [Emericellopsis atlantica]KAG9255793.1 hypothetical protein F5Z01DRAFT_699609 [Emericellopsis atlantica]
MATPEPAPLGMGGEAHWAMAVMWTFTAFVFLFLLLRIYTRVVCLSSYGLDDHIYVVAFVFLLIFIIFVQLSAQIGFGVQIEYLQHDMARVTKATLYECIGQGFAIIGMSIAKASLGVFLLRLVSLQWHRISVYVAMGLLCFWLSCVPLAFVYDKRIPGGHCPIDTRPTSYILCVTTILVDAYFALLPWPVVWDLQMPRREKYTIALSLSLGLVAAAAGIKRTTTVEGLYTPNYLYDSVGLIVWSAVEMAVTLICIGIPVCMPLYRRVWRRLNNEQSSSGYQKQSGDQEGSSSVALRTIGGGYIGKDGQVLPANMNKSKGSSHNKSFDVKLGIKSGANQTTVGRGGSSDTVANTSDEEILGEAYRHEARHQQPQGLSAHRGRQPSEGNGHRGQGIVVTKTYTINN